MMCQYVQDKLTNYLNFVIYLLPMLVYSLMKWNLETIDQVVSYHENVKIIDIYLSSAYGIIQMTYIGIG